VVPVREPGDVPDVGEDPGGAGRADAVDVHQAGTSREDLGFHRLELGVQAVQVLQFLRGHPAAGLHGQVAGPDRGQQRLVLADGLLHRRPARKQFQEQPVHPVEGLGAGQLVAAAAASATPSAPGWCSPRAISLFRGVTITMACASVASVLRPCPASNTRARAASLAGTSSTRSHRPGAGVPVPRPPPGAVAAVPVGRCAARAAAVVHLAAVRWPRIPAPGRRGPGSSPVPRGLAVGFRPAWLARKGSSWQLARATRSERELAFWLASLHIACPEDA
jgi:hypothetical protein